MNPREDRMTLTVLDDGTARVEVDGISGANHVKAEALVGEFARLLGGAVTRAKRPEGQSHQHHAANKKAHRHG